MNERTLTVEQALNKAQALCARQERCSWDIRTKLRQWHISAEDTEKIITKLKVDKFIDDERYANMFAREKTKFNKWGPIKIAYMLKSKNISEEVVQNALSEFQIGKDNKSLFVLISKKAKTIKAKSAYDLKVKLIRFGLSRGFDYNQVNETVSSIIKSEQE